MAARQFSLEPRTWAVCAGSPPCPAPGRPPCRCLLDFLTDQADGDPAGTAYLLAFRESQDVVEKARPALEQGLRTLDAAAGATKRRLRDLATYLRRGEIRDVVAAREKVEARYADDGAHDRRRRLRWPKYFPPGLAVAGAALFEGWFFGTLFRYLMNVDDSSGWRDPHFYLAYIPGVVLAMLLILAGHLLAEPVVLWRRRRAGWRDTAKPLPEWVIPLLLLGLVLAMVGSVAWARGEFLGLLAAAAGDLGDASSTGGGQFPSWVVVFLVVMLSLCAILTKVAVNNPDADSADEAAKRYEAVEARYQSLRTAVEDALVHHYGSWQALRGAIWETHSRIDNLWEMAGSQFPEILPAPTNGHQREPALPDGEVTAGLLTHVPWTPPAFGFILHIAHAHGHYSPAPYAQELDELVALANNQWSGPAPGM